ncbi:MAG TPA: SDR family NAD(P)-dependent oxidoreductase, partial [Gemmatimonadales bacterium]|nr:SDR family NAD(P)-dependent oxidoreductase [Gemmatimonadales bacterium]
MIDLRGKTALVTGGNRGIGRSVVLLLARAGADVALTYHTRAEEAEAVAKEVRSLGQRSYVAGGDLSDPDVTDRLRSGVKREMGGLDIFVANAGVWPAEAVALADMDVARWRRTREANLDSVFLSTREALRLMRAGGRVVIVSSTAGQRGEAFHGDYAASKGALIALTKSLAIECAP